MILWDPYLQLYMNLLRHFLVICLQQLYGLFQRIEHIVCGCLSVLDGHKMTHAINQSIVITFFSWFGQTSISNFDEVSKIIQAEQGKNKTKKKTDSSITSIITLQVLIQNSI